MVAGDASLTIKRRCIAAHHDADMTDRQVGRLLAAVRQHLRLRQIDVGEAADVDQKVVSLLERGMLTRVSVDKFRRVCAVLEIEPVLDLRWRGGLGDRLIDRQHALVVEAVAAELRRLGWEVLPEFTFNVYGERGSVDVLAWNVAARALLIVEVKTRLTDLQQLLMSMSRKVRLVPPLVAEERGWKRAALGHVVVIIDSRANRSTVTRHDATFAATFPGRTVAVRSWVRAPAGDMAGLWFLALRPDTPAGTGSVTSVRRVRARAVPPESAAQAPRS